MIPSDIEDILHEIDTLLDPDGLVLDAAPITRVLRRELGLYFDRLHQLERHALAELLPKP